MNNLHPAVAPVDFALRIIESDKEKRHALALLIVRNLIDTDYVDGFVHDGVPCMSNSKTDQAVNKQPIDPRR